MKLCYTAMNERLVMGVLDLKSSSIQEVPRQSTIIDHRPFGITWTNNRLYIAQPTSIWVYDQLLEEKRVLIQDLWYGIHQITCHDGYLWMVSPRLNAVQRYKFNTKAADYFFPDKELISEYLPLEFFGKDKVDYGDGDVAHYNSIFIKNDRLYLAAHNHNNPSFIKVFDIKTFKLLRCYENLGKQIHNVYEENDEVFYVDSLGSRSILSTAGFKVKIGTDGEFVRGLAITPDVFITACFPYDPVRHKRRFGHSEIVVVNRKEARVTNRIRLKNVGNVNDIRLLDVPDLGHGLLPFWGGVL